MKKYEHSSESWEWGIIQVWMWWMMIKKVAWIQPSTSLIVWYVYQPETPMGIAKRTLGGVQSEPHSYHPPASVMTFTLSFSFSCSTNSKKVCTRGGIGPNHQLDKQSPGQGTLKKRNSTSAKQTQASIPWRTTSMSIVKTTADFVPGHSCTGNNQNWWQKNNHFRSTSCSNLGKEWKTQTTWRHYKQTPTLTPWTGTEIINCHHGGGGDRQTDRQTDRKRQGDLT